MDDGGQLNINVLHGLRLPAAKEKENKNGQDGLWCMLIRSPSRPEGQA
jgi:hypothetical protein